MNNQAMLALYDRWLAELWNGDLERLDEAATALVAPAFVGHWPGQPALVRGPGGLAAVVRQGRLPFDPLTFSVEVGPLADGNFVAARWVARGAYAGGDDALPGVTATAGTPVEFRGHDILRADGDVLREYWVISEAEQLMTQLTSG